MTELDIPSATRPFAVVKKQQTKQKNKTMKTLKNLIFAAIAGITLFQTSVVRADDHRDAIITWTKHVTAFFPSGDVFGTIAGTANGDIGAGTVIGEAFNPIDAAEAGNITFEADYHFVGSKHSLTVHFRTVQAPDGSGFISGVVTEGWLKGNVVEGHYISYQCDSIFGTCFDGTFIIKKGSKNNK